MHLWSKNYATQKHFCSNKPMFAMQFNSLANTQPFMDSLHSNIIYLVIEVTLIL